MKRRRQYITLPERLAAALSLQLPAEIRNHLRQEKARAKVIIGMFDMDHIVAHSLGGVSRWWNLTPMLRSEHRTKTKKDVAEIAKVRRLDEKWEPFTRAIRSKRKPRKKKAWPSKLSARHPWLRVP
jgi:5-methylcytosine-specific restriction endonuclease McrA